MNHYTTLDFIVATFPDEKFLIADGFNDAVIGVEDSSMRLIYSVKKCIDVLVSEGMSVEEAFEHFEYNVKGGYIGEKTPIWCDDCFQ